MIDSTFAQQPEMVAVSSDLSSSAGLAVSGATSCRTARLRPPKYSFGAVESKAFRLFRDGPIAKLTTVVAPPGYGKTVLMAQLFQHVVDSGMECLWIGIDENEDDLAQLLSLVEAALGMGEEMPPLPLDYNRENLTAYRVGRVLASLSQRKNGCILFIDNIDFCHSVDVGGFLNALIYDTSDTIRLVFSSSGPVAFDTTRALLELRLRSFGPAELSFDTEDVEALFLDAGICNLPPDAATVIWEQSEGWPAAVRLMQVIAATDPDIRCYAERFNRDSSHLADILSRRLMSRLDVELIEFLCCAAELNHFSAEMIDAATGGLNATKHMRYLLDNNVLIIPLDERQTWFRFHGLFRRFLIAQSRAVLSPERRQNLLARGAAWLEERDQILQGLELAVRAGERVMASRLLEKLAWSLVRNRGDLPSFITWVEQVRSIDAVLGVEASFWFVWALIFERRYEQAKVALSHLDALIENSNFPEMKGQDLLAKAGLAEIVLKLHLDSLAAIYQRAPSWLGAHGDADHFEFAAVAGAMAIALLADHQLTAARKAIRQSQAAVCNTSSLYGRGWVANISAFAEIISGNPSAVEELLEETERRIQLEMGEGALVGAVSAIVRARAMFACGRVQLAKELIERFLPQMRANGVLDFTWMGMEVILPSAIRGVTLITLSMLRSIAREAPKRLSFLLELSVIRLQLHEGRIEDAVEHAIDLGFWSPAGVFLLPYDIEVAGERAAARMTEITLLSACGQLKRAEELIQEELLNAQRIGRRAAEVELHLAQANVHLKFTQWRLAQRSFAKAIGIAADRRLLQPFYEQAKLVSHMMTNSKLRELGIASASGNALIDEICRLLMCPHPGKSSMALEADEHGDTYGSPTPRELELLSLIEQGLDNTQIAENLSLSLRTVKWHLSNLYAKLDVKNRTSALAKARSLHML
jgi:LuxR family maltose regulon positive regulatory protein